VVYNFHNWGSSWFGLVCRLQGSQLWYMKLKLHLGLRNNFKC